MYELKICTYDDKSNVVNRRRIVTSSEPLNSH